MRPRVFVALVMAIAVLGACSSDSRSFDLTIDKHCSNFSWVALQGDQLAGDGPGDVELWFSGEASDLPLGSYTGVFEINGSSATFTTDGGTVIDFTKSEEEFAVGGCLVN